MSYDSVEAALESVIYRLAGYSATNVGRGDYHVLGHGIVKAVVLNPGPIRERGVSGAPRRIRNLWVVNIQLFVPFRLDVSTVASEIRTYRQELLDHLDTFPTLASATGVINAFVVFGAEPEQWQGEGRRQWMQLFQMDIEERSNVTIITS